MRESLTACGLLLATILPALAQTNETETGGAMMSRMGDGMVMGQGSGRSMRTRRAPMC